eukprot:TRINITY_DN807_c0_g1_i2.p1 TRINITY_DN807_c0_g1~~TRINITY_DN807_c0_g1_i2.p1  ORF type:complete len:202 (-),score=69.09 TRINITY_DN807_c0_g1_i2:182-787(-)
MKNRNNKIDFEEDKDREYDRFDEDEEYDGFDDDEEYDRFKEEEDEEEFDIKEIKKKKKVEIIEDEADLEDYPFENKTPVFTLIKEKVASGFRYRKNEGSLARDHLALERTFLAWLRTSVAAVGLGLAIAKVGQDQSHSKIAGLLFIVLGGIFLIYASFRYFHVVYLLSKGYFPVNIIGLIILIILCLISTVFAILLVALHW